LALNEQQKGVVDPLGTAKVIERVAVARCC